MSKPDGAGAVLPLNASNLTAARHSRPPKLSSRPLMTWGFLKTSWPRVKDASWY